MTNATVKRPHNRLGRWLAKRVENRIDRFWLVGMLLVIVGTTIKFGPGYVPLFVALKGLLFVRFFQKKISQLPNLPEISSNDLKPHQSRTRLIGIAVSAAVAGQVLMRLDINLYASVIFSIVITNILFVMPIVIFPRRAYAILIKTLLGDWHFAMIVLLWAGMAWLFFRYDLGYTNLNASFNQDWPIVGWIPLMLLFTFYILSVIPSVILLRRKS